MLVLIFFNIIYAFCLYKLFNLLCLCLCHLKDNMPCFPVGLSLFPRLKASSRYVCIQSLELWQIKDWDIGNTCLLNWSKTTVLCLLIKPLQLNKIIHEERTGARLGAILRRASINIKCWLVSSVKVAGGQKQRHFNAL